MDSRIEARAGIITEIVINVTSHDIYYLQLPDGFRLELRGRLAALVTLADETYEGCWQDYTDREIVGILDRPKEGQESGPITALNRDFVRNYPYGLRGNNPVRTLTTKCVGMLRLDTLGPPNA